MYSDNNLLLISKGLHAAAESKEGPYAVIPKRFFYVKEVLRTLHVTLKMSQFVALPFSPMNVDHPKDRALMTEGQCSSLLSTWAT